MLSEGGGRGGQEIEKIALRNKAYSKYLYLEIFVKLATMVCCYNLVTVWRGWHTPPSGKLSNYIRVCVSEKSVASEARLNYANPSNLCH